MEIINGIVKQTQRYTTMTSLSFENRRQTPKLRRHVFLHDLHDLEAHYQNSEVLYWKFQSRVGCFDICS